MATATKKPAAKKQPAAKKPGAAKKPAARRTTAAARRTTRPTAAAKAGSAKPGAAKPGAAKTGKPAAASRAKRTIAATAQRSPSVPQAAKPAGERSQIGPKLTKEQIEIFGAEMDALRERVIEDLGQKDVDYIRGIIKAQRNLEVAGRGLLFLSFIPPAWIAGTVSLGLAKILDNMEIGHNVMHGQYDWTNDPELSGQSFEWDTACPADHWRHSHNYRHHTHTNIVGMDRDIGYGILRMSKDQEWNPYYLGNALYAFLLMTFFEYGVALHDLEVEGLFTGEKSWDDRRKMLDRIWKKVRRQAAKDYLFFPVLAGPMAPLVFAGNFTANIIRNVWAFSIIFCGHFPEGTEEFQPEQVENETRGEWYYRQVLGSSNIEGSRLMHIMSGNLSHQIEHHLFPDLPARRYAEMAVEVREACARFGIPYNSGPFYKQLGSVFKKIVRLSLP